MDKGEKQWYNLFLYHFRKAGLAVLKEAIRLAQESSDHVCLQHALAWLYTLSSTHKVDILYYAYVSWGDGTSSIIRVGFSISFLDYFCCCCSLFSLHIWLPLTVRIMIYWKSNFVYLMLLQGQLTQRSMVKSFELSLSYLSSLGRLNHAAQLVHTRSTPANLLQVGKNIVTVTFEVKFGQYYWYMILLSHFIRYIWYD